MSCNAGIPSQGSPARACRPLCRQPYLATLPGILAACFVVHLAVGLFYLEWLDLPGVEPLYDATLYIRGAQAILDHNPEQMYYAKPLFQAYLALGMLMFGEDIHGLRVLNVMVAAMTCQMIMLVVHQVTRSRQWVILCGVVLALVPVHLVMSPYMLTEVAYAFSLALLACVFVALVGGLTGQGRPALGYFLALAACLILTSGIRPIGQYLLVLAVPVLGYLILRRREAWNSRGRLVLGLVLTVAVYFCGEPGLRRVFQTPQRSDAGEALWLGNIPTKYLGLYAPPLGHALIRAGQTGPPEFKEQVEKAFLRGMVPGSPEYNDLLRGYARQNITGNLKDFVQRVLYKTIAYIIIQAPPSLMPGQAGADSLLLALISIVVAIGTVGGMVLTFVLADWFMVGPVIILGTHWGIHALTRVRERDALGMYPILFMIAVYFYWRIISWAAGQDMAGHPVNRRHAGYRAAVLVAVCLAIGVPLHGQVAGAVRAFFPPGLETGPVETVYDETGDGRLVLPVKTSQPYSRVCAGGVIDCCVTDDAGQGRLTILPDPAQPDCKLRVFAKSGVRFADVSTKLPPQTDYAIGAEVVEAPVFSAPDRSGPHDFSVALRGSADTQYVASQEVNPNTVVLRLGRPIRLRTIHLTHYRRDVHITDFSIDVSVDGQQWRTVAREANWQYEGTDEYPVWTGRLGEAAPCRYLRLQVTKGKTVDRLLLRGLSLYE